MPDPKSKPLFYTCAPTIFVRDLETARHFYVDILQCEVLRPVGENNILLSAAGTSLLLRRRGDAAVAPTRMLLGFMVKDLEAAMAQLSAKGITFEGEVAETPLAKVVFFNDPDGTSLYLCQWR